MDRTLSTVGRLGRRDHFAHPAVAGCPTARTASLPAPLTEPARTHVAGGAA